MKPPSTRPPPGWASLVGVRDLKPGVRAQEAHHQEAFPDLLPEGRRKGDLNQDLRGTPCGNTSFKEPARRPRGQPQPPLAGPYQLQRRQPPAGTSVRQEGRQRLEGRNGEDGSCQDPAPAPITFSGSSTDRPVLTLLVLGRKTRGCAPLARGASRLPQPFPHGAPLPHIHIHPLKGPFCAGEFLAWRSPRQA